MSGTTPRLRGQTTSYYHVDDAGWFIADNGVKKSTASTTATLPRSIPMGWHRRELTPEEKMERAKEVKAQQEKDIKRKVLGPKRSRWG